MVDKKLLVEYDKTNSMGNTQVDPNESEQHTESTKIKPKSRLEELKYSYCPDLEMPELKEEMLYRATDPKNIGIISSGGLSNRIVDKIRDEYSSVFKNMDFNTHYETLNRSIIPIRASDTEPEDVAPELDSNVVNEGDLSATENKPLTSPELDEKTDKNIETRTKSPGEKHMLETDEHNRILYEDDDFIFEADSDSEFKQSSSEELVSSSGQTTLKNKEPVEVQKPMTLRERAHHIFIELKRKLGLIREHTPSPEHEPKTIEEPEQELKPGHTTKLSLKTTDELHEEEISEKPVIEQEFSSMARAQNALKKVIGDKDILFIFTCLDDEHDIENTLILSELTSKENILTIVIASLPRYFGNVENVYATNKILQRLRLIAEIVILIPYFETLDFKIIPKLIVELLEVISKPGLINVDVADLKIIVKGGNVGVITFGSGKHHTRHKDALFEAIDSRLVNVEFASVGKALINVKGGKDMTLGEVEGLAEQIRKRIKPGATLILGATIDPELYDQIKLFILIGITPMQIMVNMYANE